MTPAQVETVIERLRGMAKDKRRAAQDVHSAGHKAGAQMLRAEAMGHDISARILTEALAASEAEDAAKAARRGCEECGGIMAHVPTCRRYAMR